MEETIEEQIDAYVISLCGRTKHRKIPYYQVVRGNVAEGKFSDGTMVHHFRIYFRVSDQNEVEPLFATVEYLLLAERTYMFIDNVWHML